MVLPQSGWSLLTQFLSAWSRSNGLENIKILMWLPETNSTFHSAWKLRHSLHTGSSPVLSHISFSKEALRCVFLWEFRCFTAVCVCSTGWSQESRIEKREDRREERREELGRGSRLSRREANDAPFAMRPPIIKSRPSCTAARAMKWRFPSWPKRRPPARMCGILPP